MSLLVCVRACVLACVCLRVPACLLACFCRKSPKVSGEGEAIEFTAALTR